MRYCMYESASLLRYARDLGLPQPPPVPERAPSASAEPGRKATFVHASAMDDNTSDGPGDHPRPLQWWEAIHALLWEMHVQAPANNSVGGGGGALVRTGECDQLPFMLMLPYIQSNFS